MNAFHILLEMVIFASLTSVTVEKLYIFLYLYWPENKFTRIDLYVSALFCKPITDSTPLCYGQKIEYIWFPRFIARYSNITVMRVKRYFYDCPQCKLNKKLDQIVRLHNAVRTWRDALPKICCTQIEGVF